MEASQGSHTKTKGHVWPSQKIKLSPARFYARRNKHTIASIKKSGLHMTHSSSTLRDPNTRKPRSLICSKGERFVKLGNVKVPNTSKVVVINCLSLEACEKECLRSCNCTAYATTNITEGGSGCIAWHGDLVDTRIFTAGGQEFYLRVYEPKYAKKSKGSVATKRIRITMVIWGVFACFNYVLWGRSQDNGIYNFIRLNFRRLAWLIVLQMVSLLEDNSRSSSSKAGECGAVASTSTNSP
ncbi:hypothetical protein FNV43_RR01988 [Rhamnella rubrinervis]|uniref:Apple domain-containing protein n=1 Tax=Rhamnella rubrinervis TaxID=2594499 RepID=A0A8K0HRH1_9ROSA|nr:hypothetical protein FNV43_RR01988 [Rhamnella rubrinervis]